MTDSSSSDHQNVSYSMIDKIDRICDQFEKELKCNSSPKLEEYLLLIEEPVRDQLLRDLVAIDFEFAQRKGAVDFADYLRRFPKSHHVLQTLQNELQSAPQNSHSAESPVIPSAGLTGDITLVTAAPPQFRHFMLLEIAGSGGFGTVWRAMDLRLQREVAIKIPRSDRTGRNELSGVAREAQVAAKLRHPNIVSVHEVGEENGTPFIVTDYIDGMNLKEWKKKNSIRPYEAARMVAKIAVAIQYAHNNGVIHRDLKLANILMDVKGEPHVADFGLAKREARDDSLAIDGQVMGTPAYMAPEQARADHAAIDRRTDVYSLGVILYELITGTTPFRGDMKDILEQILEIPPVSPRLIRPDIPKDLEGICLKCLAKDNAKRYESAHALADDLNLFLNGETLRGIPAALPNRVWKWFRRNRRFVAVISLVAFLVASASSAFVAWRTRNAPPPVPVFPVQFITEPRGCEITIVTLAPETGEPDPTKIQKARGKTPLNISLPAGDYLVVAVLNSHQFHEVYRHVPERDESLSFGYGYLRWKRLPSGVIELPVIKIPPPYVSVGMGICEGTDRLVEPALPGQPSRTWRIPSFYVDVREVSVQDWEDWHARGVGVIAPDKTSIVGPLAAPNYYQTVRLLEAIGKRPPSAAEIYYLSKTICPDPHISPCVLNEKSNVYGVNSSVWEWSSTKPGAPFSGSAPISKDIGLDATSHMIGSGDPGPADHLTHTGFRFLQAHQSQNAGIRGVRSIAPRLTAQDFIAVVNSNPAE